MASAPIESHVKRMNSGSVSAQIRLYRSSMLRKFGLLYYLMGLGFFFRKLRLHEESVERIRQAANNGHVVYVLHTRSRMDWLALNQALNARRLPIASFSSGVRSTLFMPLRQAVKVLWRWLNYRIQNGPLPDPVESGMLTSLLKDGHRACLFIHRERTLRDRFFPHPNPDIVSALFAAQEELDRPIQLIPTVVVWNRAPAAARTEVGRFLLGSEDWPGALGKLHAVATRHADAIVQTGEPISLQDFLARYPDEPPARRQRILRVAVRRYLFREQSIVRGPRIRSHRWMRRLVLQSREVNTLIHDEARRTGQNEAEVRAYVARTYDKIAARFRFAYVRWADVLLRWVWQRMYSGVDMRDEDVDRIRDALRKGTPILIPSHRSHIDYLMMSQQLYRHDVIVPHIVAGMNLSFFPAGFLARRMGAFFIKRRFGEERIFPAVFSRYVRQLIREGFPIEFFIEGGRSRTGKMLPPRPGVLRMVLDSADAVSRGNQFAVTLLPIHISYERIAEAKTYAKELSGEGKRAESVSAVFSARRIFRQRHGKVYIRVGEPIDAREEIRRAGDDWSALSETERNDAAKRTGERVVHAIGRQAVVLPSNLAAAALLIPNRKGITRAKLQELALALLNLVKAEDSMCSDALVNTNWAIERATREFIQAGVVEAFEGDAGPIYRAVSNQRMTLDFHKNALMGFLAPGAMLALSLRSGNADAFPIGQACQRFDHLAGWLVQEFIFDPSDSLEERVAHGARQLEAFGAIETNDERYRVIDRERLEALASLCAPILEGYQLTAKALRRLRGMRFDNASLNTNVITIGEGLLAIDEVKRPEALSSVTIKNALRLYAKQGLYTLNASGRLSIESEQLKACHQEMKAWQE